MRDWFIDDKGKVRWVHTFIEKNIEWDNCTTHLIVSMENNLNQPCRVNELKVESIDTENFFETEKETQMEILRRERFDK